MDKHQTNTLYSLATKGVRLTGYIIGNVQNCRANVRCMANSSFSINLEADSFSGSLPAIDEHDMVHRTVFERLCSVAPEENIK